VAKWCIKAKLVAVLNNTQNHKDVQGNGSVVLRILDLGKMNRSGNFYYSMKELRRLLDKRMVGPRSYSGVDREKTSLLLTGSPIPQSSGPQTGHARTDLLLSTAEFALDLGNGLCHEKPTVK
jgi:hypothetical protein